MSHEHVRRVVLAAAAALLSVPGLAGQAAAAPAAPVLAVAISVDQGSLVVDRSPGLDPVPQYSLAYTIRVDNTTADPSSPPAHGVEVVDSLPAGLAPVAPLPAHATVNGNEIRIAVGDLGFGAWQDTIHAKVVSTGPGPFSNAAVVTSTDGAHLVSAPAVTKVTVISAVTIERAPDAVVADPAVATAPAVVRPARATRRPAAPAGATKVLGLTVSRSGDGHPVEGLARTGVDLRPLAGLGLLLLLVGSALVRAVRPTA